MGDIDNIAIAKAPKVQERKENAQKRILSRFRQT